MKVELENVKPMDIEKRSFEIITEELGDTPLIPGTELVVKRCIHTSADFDYGVGVLPYMILITRKIFAFPKTQWKKRFRQLKMAPVL